MSLDRRPDLPDASREVVLVREGAVGWVWLNRPERRNATTAPMMAELGAALRAAEGVRVLVLGGVGPTFCAGRDLSEVEPEHDDAEAVLRDIYAPVLEALRSFPAPTVAAVQGAALGTGFGLAFACDLVVAAASAKLGSPFVRLGAAPDSGAHLALVRSLGRWRAMWLIATGTLLEAADPRISQLCSAVVEDADFEAAVRELAEQLAAAPTLALVGSRELVDNIDAGLFARTLAWEASLQGRLARTHDFEEGMRAFQERRSPRFDGR